MACCLSGSLQIPAFSTLIQDNWTLLEKQSHRAMWPSTGVNVFSTSAGLLVINLLFPCIFKWTIQGLQHFLRVYPELLTSIIWPSIFCCRKKKRRKKIVWGFLLILDEHLPLHLYMMSSLISFAFSSYGYHEDTKKLIKLKLQGLSFLCSLQKQSKGS